MEMIATRTVEEIILIHIHIIIFKIIAIARSGWRVLSISTCVCLHID